LVVVSLVGIVAALRNLKLAPNAGEEVSGHRSA